MMLSRSHIGASVLRASLTRSLRLATTRTSHATASTQRRRHLSTESILSSLSLESNESAPLAGAYTRSKWQGSGTVLTSHNPATGKVLGTVRGASLDQVSRGIDDSREAFKLWRLVPAPKRGDVLRKLRSRLEEAKPELGQLISLEMGKILSEGLGEVQEFLDILDLAVGLSRSFNGSVVPSERAKHFITEVPNPLGVVSVTSAFNFPVAVFGWNAALALVTGNSTIWKPSPTSSLAALAVSKIMIKVFEEEGLPSALCTLLCGGTDVGKSVVSDRRVDLVSFTGSEAVGRLVGMEVAGRFGKSILELGGNNAAVVLPDANQALAVRTVLFSALGTAGQRCTSTRRLFLHSSIADSFLSSLTVAYKSTLSRVGDPLDPATLVGPLHSRSAVEAYELAIKEAREQGGQILVGGKRANDLVSEKFREGNWVEPTVVRFDKSLVTSGKAQIMQRETFAPILFVTTFDTLDEAIEMNNSVPQGLSSSLFTRDMSSAFQWIGPTGSDCGIVNVNGSTSGAEIGAPFGGNKSTGWGRESGGDAWKQYCRWSSCTLNWSDELGMAQGVKFE